MGDKGFDGKIAVVTGGVRGIGLACAKALAARGARVALWDRDVERGDAEAKSLPGAIVVGVDVADEASVSAAKAETERRLGPADLLICSAGVTGPNLTVANYPLEEWRKVVEINLTGTFLCNKLLSPGMVERGYGRIVNIASIAGKEGNPNASAYSASKAAVIGLTKSLGKELASTNVRVNCITPAAIQTEMFAQMTEQHIAFMLSKIPMARFGTVEEAAALAVWLCSPECSFSTGAVFDLSGGRATY